MYPTKDEFKNATEQYLARAHESYFNSFSEKKWDIFYQLNIQKKVV